MKEVGNFFFVNHDFFSPAEKRQNGVILIFSGNRSVVVAKKLPRKITHTQSVVTYGYAHGTSAHCFWESELTREEK